MSKESFLDSKEWLILSQEIRNKITEVCANALNEDTFDKVRYDSGYVAALRDMLDLPNKILHDEGEKKSDEPSGTLHIAERPRTSFRG